MIVRPIRNLQIDERGRPYVIGAGGQRMYVPQSATRPTDGLISEYDFDTRTGEWKRKTNWNNVLGLGTLAAIGAGGAAAAVGGGGAATAVAPSAVGSSAPAPLAATFPNAANFVAPAVKTATTVAGGSGMAFPMVPFLIASIAGQTATSVYNTRTAGRTNRDSLNAQREESARAAEIERERLADERERAKVEDARLAAEREERTRQYNEDLALRRAAEEEKRRQYDTDVDYRRSVDAERKRQYDIAVARDKERWSDYVRANTPAWTLGGSVLGSLGQLAGLPVTSGRNSSAMLTPDGAGPDMVNLPGDAFGRLEDDPAFGIDPATGQPIVKGSAPVGGPVDITAAPAPGINTTMGRTRSRQVPVQAAPAASPMVSLSQLMSLASGGDPSALLRQRVAV